jgi:hypothetical protein
MATQTRTQREQAGKKAAATRKRNAASRSTTATRRSATQTRRTAKRTTRSTGRQARTTALTAVGRELDAAGTRVEALVLGARRGVAIQVGAALEARDAVKRTAEFAVRTASRRKTLNNFERRGERALSWNKR